MSDSFDDFEGPAPVRRDREEIEAESLLVALDGYEGPLDLLLSLARAQKVDLRRISVLKLAEQYLGFIAEARRLRIELAADYLVMAAWLAFLKSRLLLPQPDTTDEPSGEELAARLAFQLERLEAMRRVAAELMARDQLGRDVFARGMTETMTVRRRTEWNATLSDLLRAYSRVKTREEYRPLQIDRAAILSLDGALARLRQVVGMTPGWGELAAYLPEGWALEPRKRRSALASSFAACLELAKRGEIEIRQSETFAPIYIRPRAAPEGAG